MTADIYAIARRVSDAYCAWAPEDVPVEMDEALAELHWAAREHWQNTTNSTEEAPS